MAIVAVTLLHVRRMLLPLIFSSLILERVAFADGLPSAARNGLHLGIRKLAAFLLGKRQSSLGVSQNLAFSRSSGQIPNYPDSCRALSTNTISSTALRYGPILCDSCAFSPAPQADVPERHGFFALADATKGAERPEASEISVHTFYRILVMFLMNWSFTKPGLMLLESMDTNLAIS